ALAQRDVIGSPIRHSVPLLRDVMTAILVGFEWHDDRPRSGTGPLPYTPHSSPPNGRSVQQGRLAAVGVAFEVDVLVFQAAPQPLDEHVVDPAAPPVHRDADAGLRQHAGEVPLVNWLPWSVLKISGLPNRASASSSAARQNPTSIVFDSRQASTARLAQSMIATM